MGDKLKKHKILYLQGRPEAHKLHGRFARSLGSDVEFVDFKMKWQDKSHSFFYNLICWVVNAFAIPKKAYDYFLIDNLHFTPIIMKLLFLRRRQKIIVHLGSHTLFFMYSNQFSKLNNFLHKWALRRYDALLCEGKMAEELAKKILGESCPPTYVTFLGPPEERIPSLLDAKPDFNSKRIILLASGPTAFRAYYKGLDIMLKAFSLAQEHIDDLELDVLGHWEESVISKELKGYSKEVVNRIHFHGRVDNIHDYFSASSLCLHCTRGDAFPTATVEAMTAGIPTIVSEWTGTKEILAQVDDKYIVPLDEKRISNCIQDYFKLSIHQKSRLSGNLRQIAMEYTEEKAILHYKKTFLKIIGDIA